MNAANPWSTSTEYNAQRTDLWRLNLAPVISALGEDQDVPSPEQAALYAFRASLPVQKISTRQIVRGTVPRNFPGVLESLDTVRIDFFHDTTANQSALMRLLRLWRLAVRTGRSSNGAETAPVLESASSKPIFSFDLTLEHLTQQEDSNDEITTVVGAIYSLSKCWLGGLQHAALDKGAAAGNHYVTAQLHCSRII